MELTLKQQKQIENKDFTIGNLAKKILLHTLFLFLSSSLALLFTTMDLFTVAQFGEGNISSGAIGSTTSLINIILSAFVGLTTGASVIIANAKGEGNKEKLKRSIGTTIFLTLFLGIIIQIIGASCAKPLLILMQTEDEILEKASTYLLIYFLGSPFMLLFQCGAAIFRALGDSKRPLIAIALGGIVNIGLNFLMVIVFKLDVMGVAIATVASQAVSLVIIYLFLIKDKQFDLQFSLKQIRYHHDVGKDIIRLSTMSGLQSIIFNITNIAVQASVNSISTGAVIGKAAANNLECYEYALLNSISTTCSVTTAQNFGAKNKERVKKSLFYCILFELTISTIVNLIIFALHEPLLNIFLNKGEDTYKEAMETGYLFLLILGVPYGICGVAECFTSYLRGMKYSFVPTTVSLVGIVLFRLIFIFCFFNLMPQFHNFSALISIYPISWLICIVAYIPLSIFYTKKAFINKNKLNISPKSN